MCGRYSLWDTSKSDAKIKGLLEKVHDNYNVAPTQTMPVIVRGDQKTQQLELMHWGIPRQVGKDLVKEIINTRSDKAFERFWGNTVLHRRCLIPASGFYEWKTDKEGKHPYYIHPKDQELFTFAGIWSEWIDDKGNKRGAYSIITTDANKEMKDIHNRMPVILDEDEQDTWLSDSDQRKDIEGLLNPYHDGGLETYEVSQDVNNARNNARDLVDPVKK